MLRVEGLNAYYGKKQVLFGIDLELPDGTIGAVIGPNGAGKSTVLRAIFGLIANRSGQISLDGEDVSRAEPVQNIVAGMAFVPQGGRVFRDLTVAENLRMGGYTLDADTLAQRRDMVFATFPVLAQRGRQAAGALSGGERQMLAFGMALMLRPKLLMVDEPSIGMAPKLVTQIFDSVRAIRNDMGTSVLIVEQQARQVLRIADSVIVIRAGQMLSHGPVDNYRGEDVLRQVYLSHRETQANQRGGCT